MDQTHRHEILLVDDYDDLRDAVTCLLELTGHSVVAAASGRDALAILQSGYRPCAVLLDLVMPDMDGWEVHARMRAAPALAEIPVVFMSGDSSLARARGQGVSGFLMKPAAPEEIERMLAYACSMPSHPQPSDFERGAGRGAMPAVSTEAR